MWEKITGRSFIIIMFGVANIHSILADRGETECEQVVRSVSQMIKSVFSGDSIYKLSRGIFAVITETKNERDCGLAVKNLDKMIADYNNLN